jgi:hypothetical protein
MTPAVRHERRSYPFLTRLTLALLIINTLTYAAEFLWLGIDLEIGIVVTCLSVATVFVATGWRWTPAVGALLAGAILLGNPFLLHNLSLSPSTGFFWAAATQLVCSVTVVVAGVGATVQNYWVSPRSRKYRTK